MTAADLADVAELVDALDLGSSAARRGGSSPLIRTMPLAVAIFVNCTPTAILIKYAPAQPVKLRPASQGYA